MKLIHFICVCMCVSSCHWWITHPLFTNTVWSQCLHIVHHSLSVLPSPSSSFSFSTLFSFILPLVPLFLFFSTNHLPYSFSLFDPPSLLPPHTHTHNLSKLSAIFSLPNNILSTLSLILFLLPPLFQEATFYFWPVVCICHVRASAISWSSGDSSRSPCLKSCYGQMRGTGHDGAACWRR